MRIPHPDKLTYNNVSVLNSEFGWLFNENKQFIFGINADGSVYIEYGEVNKNGDYVSSEHWFEFPSKSQITENDPLWNFSEYNFFSNGKDLVPLYDDCLEMITNLNLP